ncbi:MAG: T9SS type A sorting domain-containing protein [Ignavibacteria bacterium]|nr:T9SS type A sorting domain-containing protein [Ignavibacteria bacterium]
MIKTVNTGQLWLNDTVPGSGDIAGVTGSAHSRFNWFVRNDNKVYVNPHNASNWQLDYTTPSGNYTYITIERNGYFSGAVFAAKDNGGISRTFFLSLGITQISSVIPGRFALKQNYPNPFNPVTKIRFSIPPGNSNSKIYLGVYDITGRLVKQLVNEKMSAGVYEADFNASELPSGVYFYRLTAGSFSVTNKMVLLK